MRTGTLRMKTARLFVAVVALLAGVVAAGRSGVAGKGEEEKLGTVSFGTSCSEEVQPQFNRAVALLHSFQFGPAIEGFNGVLAGDKTCAMAYWGIALSDWGNPFAAGLKAPGQLEKGWKAVEQGRAAAPKTERERAYIEAVAHLYADTGKFDQRARKLQYENAMESLNAAYPTDTEGAIFYALGLAAAADPADKSYTKQIKAGGILENLFVQYPDHPGLAHYIIHAYDVPPLAGKAVGAAKRYGEIAPSTPHALHMPSHTFTRTGDWQASINSNIASAAVAQRSGQPVDQLHASDYLVYAYLQKAEDGAALKVVSGSGDIFAKVETAAVASGAGSSSAAYFARAAMPARYALERRDWAAAAELEAVKSPYPYTEAITYFARGVGAAHMKDGDGARAAIAKLDVYRDELQGMKEIYWVDQVEIQRAEVAALLAMAEGRAEEAVAGMRAAAEREDRTEKSAVTPGPLAPAREQLGEMLLEMKRPGEALKEFEGTLGKEPNRFRSLYGAGEAAKEIGDRKKEREYFGKLLEMTGSGERSELVEVRKKMKGE